MSNKLVKSKPKPIERRVEVKLIPTTIRVPKDIYEALADIVLFEHKTSISDLTRDWIVDRTSAFMRNPTYQKWLRRKEEAELKAKAKKAK